MEERTTPILARTPNAKKIMCKDCFFRDRTIIDTGERLVPVGITKDFCVNFPPPDSNGKPHDVLFLNAKCPLYQKDVE